MNALQVNGVTKSFNGIRALNGVSFRVDRGEVLGLLGPNGSGKSTLMKIIVGILKPDMGNIQVLGTDVGTDPITVKKTVGYVPESPRLYEFLSGTEYLDFVADVHGLDADSKRERISEFLKALDLEGRENELISGYSQGMKQKLAIIAGLLHRPQILILDEPLNSLDPRSARIVKDLIHKLRDDGVPTVFSTHVLDIADAICDRIVIMTNGRVLEEGTAKDIKAKAGVPGSTLEELFLKLTGSSDTGYCRGPDPLRFGSIFRLAIVLTKSQLRGTQRSKWVARLFGDPRIVFAMDIILLLALGLVGYAVLSVNTLAGLREVIRAIEEQGLASIPTVIAFAVIVLGVLYEISQPVQSMSTDLVNWLPISPTEYVAGSVISESYIYSIMLSLFIGVLLGPAIYFGESQVWITAAIMSVVGLFIVMRCRNPRRHNEPNLIELL